MLRQIDVSTPVYAAIWACRRDGEETEDQILKRLLECKSTNSIVPAISVESEYGFFDKRNMVEFPPRFKISREYKGKEYSAEARDGAWVRLDNGKKFRSLNQLNSSIAAGPENVWNGSWTYIGKDGLVRSIDMLRKA